MLVRALLVLMIVLNAGAAAWWIARDPPPPPAPVEPPPGVARLQLVSERAASPVSAAATPAPPPTAPVASQAATADAATPPQCFSLGPFATRAAADAALAKVRPLAQRAAVRTPVTQAPARGWRVVMPPQASTAEAEALVARITAAGFSDLLVVREGAQANSIALGLYRNEDGARSRAQALNAAGFAAQVEPIDGEATGPLWLEVRADAALPPARAQSVAGANQHRPLDCASVR